jgi:hypothetical protein
MAYAGSVSHDAKDESKFWAAEELVLLVRESPERAWPLIQEAVRRSKTDRVLALSLENLVWLRQRRSGHCSNDQQVCDDLQGVEVAERA